MQVSNVRTRHVHPPVTSKSGFFYSNYYSVFTIRLIHAVYLFICLMALTLTLPRPTVAQQLTIVSDPYPPLGYVKNGEIVGFTVELLKELLKRTGIDGTFAMYPWARAYELAQQEKNILIYQLTWTEERDRLFQLVGPVVGDTDALWKLKKREDIVLDSLDDAKQYRVGVVRDYYVHKYLLEHGFEDSKNLEPIHDDDRTLKSWFPGALI